MAKKSNLFGEPVVSSSDIFDTDNVSNENKETRSVKNEPEKETVSDKDKLFKEESLDSYIKRHYSQDENPFDNEPEEDLDTEDLFDYEPVNRPSDSTKPFNKESVRSQEQVRGPKGTRPKQNTYQENKEPVYTIVDSETGEVTPVEVLNSNTGVYEDEPKKSNRKAIILGVIIALCVACLGFLGYTYYRSYQDDQAAKQLAQQQQEELLKQQQEEQQRQAEEQKKREEEERLAQEKAAQEAQEQEDENSYTPPSYSRPSNNQSSNNSNNSNSSNNGNYAIDEPEDENDLKDYQEPDYQNREPMDSVTPNPVPEETTPEETPEDNLETQVQEFTTETVDEFPIN